MHTFNRPSYRLNTASLARRASLALATAAMVLASAQPARAIPVFARKYGKSCVTCHTVFTKLNAFGRAFRLNGYRFPAGEDGEATQQEPVNLGHKVHKKVWPKVVWPGKLPGNAPVSFHLASWISFTPEGDKKVSFDQVGGSVTVNVAGTLGERFSAWAGFAVRGSAGDSDSASVELERVFVTAKAFREKPYLNLRLGRIEPGAVPFSMHRTLGLAPWYTTVGVADNNVTLEPAQLGAELNGVVARGRLYYALGVVEGTSSNGEKDFYGRLAYKIGGMRSDGWGGATASSPWRDDSLRIGAFGYLGFARLGDDRVFQDDRFWIVGGDISWLWRDLNLMAAFTYASHKRPALDDANAGMHAWHIFAQIDYVIFPWLVPMARFEQRSINDDPSTRIMGGVYVLLRPNVRAQTIATIEKIGEDGHFELSQLLVGLNMAL